MIHGVPLCEGNYRVFVVEAHVPEASLPIPVANVMDIVAEAMGFIVTWPKELVLIVGEYEV